MERLLSHDGLAVVLRVGKYNMKATRSSKSGRCGCARARRSIIPGGSARWKNKDPLGWTKKRSSETSRTDLSVWEVGTENRSFDRWGQRLCS